MTEVPYEMKNTNKPMGFLDKKVLVTGADGFIGSHLVEALLKEKAIVRAFVYYNAFNRWGWLDSLDTETLNKIDVFCGDIRDTNCVFEAVKGVHVVFHLAALIGIPYSYFAPESYIDTNIKGTLNILQAGMKFGSEKILITSTSEVYGSAKYTPIDESHPLQGQSPYAASKIGADKIAESFYRSFDAPVTIVRPFNTYGPRQSARAVIPTIITQLLSETKQVCLGNTDTKRDFVFVQDTARGFLSIALSDKTIGEEINIASQDTVSIAKLAEKIKRLMNSQAEIAYDITRIRPEKSEVRELMGSNQKLAALTNWKPNTRLEDGLKETIAWFKDRTNLKFYKPGIYNI
jgi:NAD dependent epimerase/dehydratase